MIHFSKAHLIALTVLVFSLSPPESQAADDTASTDGSSSQEGLKGDENAASAEDVAAKEKADADLATARLHFGNGVELISATPPNYQDAYRQFELALAKSGRSWKVLGNLGLCALKLERDGEALEFYREYLEKGGEEIDPQERASIEKELLLINGSLATVTIESSEATARITVERKGSNVPAQLYELTGGSAQLRLRSGQLTIRASSANKDLEWQPVLAAGDESSHVFDFSEKVTPAVVAAPAAAVSESPVEDAAESGGPSTMRIAGYVTAGVGVLSLGGGLVTALMSQSKESSARDSCINNVCEESAEDDFDSAASLATVANILFIGGGVLAATGVTLVILGGDKAGEKGPTSASLSLSPLMAPGGGGIFASGTF